MTADSHDELAAFADPTPEQEARAARLIAATRLTEADVRKTEQPRRERCGFLIEFSASMYIERPGAYRISRDGQSNIVGQRFFEQLEPVCDDAAFEKYMELVLSPGFPHPFMLEEGE